jgi:outer membrane protein assembly factor BamE
MRYFAVLASAFAVTTLTACSLPERVAEKVQPYRIDVRQGNFVDQAMVSQLQKGMSQEQVRFVLGTPLLVDIFHSNRWDYVYRFKRGGGGEETRRLSVFFVDGKLDRVDGDVVAGTPPEVAVAPPARVIDLGVADPSAPREEEKKSSWWSSWWPW